MTQRLECPIARAAAQTPDNIAMDCGAKQLTYAQLDRQTANLAQRLADRGVASGDRIAYQLTDRWSALGLFWAILRRDAIACPISDRLPPGAALQLARQLRATLTIGDSDTFSLAAGNIAPNFQADNNEQPGKMESSFVVPPSGGFDRLTMPPEGGTTNRRNPLGRRGAGLSERGLPTRALDLPATILMSSGSTGEPKPIVHDWRAHYLSARGSGTNLPLNCKDRILGSLPAYHVGGLAIAIRCALSGASLVLPAGETDDLNRVIVTRRVSHVSLVTTQLKRWLGDEVDRRAIDSLRAVLLGGSGWPAELISEAWAVGLPLHTTYGLTEMASQVTTTPTDVSPRHRISSGRLLPHRQLMIDETGQILVRGRTLCRGYLRDGQVVPVVDPQGWFATGDEGSLDDDGFLTVTGRRDNRFISGGENIHPEEIESALLALGGVIQAIVVPIPDDQFGCRPVAFVKVHGAFVKVHGAFVEKHRVFVETDSVTAGQLRAALADTLPKFKVPDFIWPWPTESPPVGGKPDRQRFQELALRRGRERADENA